MTTILPKGEKTRRAVRWISEQLKEDSHKPLWPLINEAITRFDLNPFESEALIQFYKKEE